MITKRENINRAERFLERAGTTGVKAEYADAFAKAARVHLEIAKFKTENGYE